MNLNDDILCSGLRQCFYVDVRLGDERALLFAKRAMERVAGPKRRVCVEANPSSDKIDFMAPSP